MKSRLCALLFAIAALFAFTFVGCGSSDMERGRACMAIGDYILAVEIYRGIIRKQPGNFEARYGQALALFHLAYKHHRESSANQARMQEEWRQVIEALEIAKNLQTTPKLVRNLAVAYYNLAVLLRSDNPSRSRNLFEQSFVYDSSYADIYNHLGAAYLLLKELDAAEKVLRRGCARFPNHAGLQYHLGLTLYMQGRQKEALRQWEETLRLSPHHAQASKWKARVRPRGVSPAPAGK